MNLVPLYAEPDPLEDKDEENNDDMNIDNATEKTCSNFSAASLYCIYAPKWT